MLPAMKKLITLSFLFFNLITSSPVDLTDATDVTEVGCLVPEEYCSGHKLTEFRCDVPAGWSCGGDPDLRRRTMTETVTVNAILPTLPTPDGRLPERDPARLFTRTEEMDSKEITIDLEELDVEPVSAVWAVTGAPVRQAGDYEYMTYLDHILDGPSPTETPTTVPQSSEHITKYDEPTPDTTDDQTSFDCPPLKPILEVSCVDRTRLVWNDFKITWGPAWNDRVGCRRLHRELDKRGLVTGFHCAQVADQESNTWLMEARGHRPRFPRTLVADAIRATFSNDNTLYYRGYDTRMLCERVGTAELFDW